MRGGCLWNSFVMVGSVSAFLAMIRRTLPELLRSLTGTQRSPLREIYATISASNFSDELITSVMWLNERDLDIRCIRLKPYGDNGRVLIDVQQVIPLPEATAQPPIKTC